MKFSFSTESQDTFLRRLAAAFLYFLCLIAFYIDIGEDMGAGYFLPIALPVMALLVLTQAGTKLSLFDKRGFGHLFAGLAWASAFPLCYAWTFSKVWYQSLICYDFLTGTAIFVFLLGLSAVLARLARTDKEVWAAAGFLALLDLLAIVVPFIEYGYYIIFWHSLSPASLMAIYLTNWHESLDFIQSNVGTARAMLITAVLLLCLYGAARLNRALLRATQEKCRAEGMRPGKRHFSYTATATALIGLFLLFWYVPQTSFSRQLENVLDYVEETQMYSLGHEERYDALNIDQREALPMKAPGTVIIVVGESASRNYMKAYTPDFPYEDTPWLSAHLQDRDFDVMTHAYSSWTQTVPSLQRALTEQSQYNGKEFFDSTSIIDVAKRAGYDTYWFSNQGRYGQFDSAVTLVAKTADHAEWTDDTYDLSDKYDETLLKYLKTIDPQKNNFIVFHIMGSHIYYNNRYPTEFNQWHGESEVTSVESYANSIHYTDYILQQIFDYAQKNLNLTAMVYFSDHGENLKISHNPDIFTYDMVRIPFFVYLSPAYQEALPGRSATLRFHRGRYFTNDMLYNTICGLLNAPSDRYDAREDLTSPDYAYTKENLTTMLGEQNLTDDPEGGEETGF